MKYKPLIAGLALTVVGLAGCSSTSSDPAPGESASNPSASAPAAEASSQAPEASTKSLDEVVITGEVAGLNFSKAPDEVSKVGGLAEAVEKVPIKPAECKALVTQAVADAANAETVLSVAQTGTEGYTSSVVKNGPSLSETRKNAEKCKTFTIDLGIDGVPPSQATTKISDIAANGAEDGYLTVSTIDIAGQKQSTITAFGKVGDITVSVSGAGTAKQATVEKIFAAQVEKINS